MVKAVLKKPARGAQWTRLPALVRDFRTNRHGNVAVITALAALPMVAAMGCALDYSMASMVKTKLQAAADAASLATVSINSSVVTTAKNMSGNGTVSGGSTFATSYFNANLAQAPESNGYTASSLVPTATVTKTATTITATVAFTAKVPTYFMGIMGHSNIALSGTSTASYTFPTYINFYLMLDVSGSMSFPSTLAEQARLQAVNPDNLNGSNGYPGGCTFACHFTAQGVCAQTSAQGNPWQGSIPAVGTSHNPGTNPSPGGYCQGFIISRLGTTPVTLPSGNNSINGNNVNWSNTQVTSCPTAGTTSCIQLRADAVGYAVNQLLSTAANSELVTNQFQVGLYPFIQYLYSYFPLTTNLTGSSTTSGTINYAAANLASLLDTGVNSNLGSGGTHFENAFPSMNTLISSVGTGATASSPLPYVFLITDGVDNSQTYPPFTGSNPQIFNTSLCTTLKNRGITIAILYIPYEPIQNPTTFAGSEDYNVNALVPPESNDVPNNLQSCASNNFYYTANTPTDINNALIAMFDQAVSTAHISN
jgi:Flp pilus assembly protein TadG